MTYFTGSFIAIVFFALTANASNEPPLKGEQFSNAIINILSVEACKFGSFLSPNPPPSGLKCHLPDMTLLVEFLEHNEEFLKVVSCVHLNVQQRVQIRTTVDMLIKRVLASNRARAADVVVGTRTPIKVAIVAYPGYKKYPSIYHTMMDLSELAESSDTFESMAAHLNSRGYQRQSRMQRDETDGSRRTQPTSPYATCSSIARYQRKAIQPNSRPLGLKEVHLPGDNIGAQRTRTWSSCTGERNRMSLSDTYVPSSTQVNSSSESKTKGRSWSLKRRFSTRKSRGDNSNSKSSVKYETAPKFSKSRYSSFRKNNKQKESEESSRDNGD